MTTRKTEAEQREIYDQVQDLNARGMTIKAACEQLGINEKTYGNYVRKFRDGETGGDPNELADDESGIDYRDLAHELIVKLLDYDLEASHEALGRLLELDAAAESEQ